MTSAASAVPALTTPSPSRWSSSGAWFPAAELMVPGYSWTNDYTMAMQSNIEGASFDVNAATTQS
jgi:hypothetical protein